MMHTKPHPAPAATGSERTCLPDDETYIFGRRRVLTERELVTRRAQIGPKGEWVTIHYVASRIEV